MRRFIAAVRRPCVPPHRSCDGEETVLPLRQVRPSALRPKSTPGRLILWKAIAGIMHVNLVRKVRPPSPKDEIGHAGPRSVRKGRHKDSCMAALQETFGKRPRCRYSPLREIQFPRTAQFSQTHAIGLPADVVSQIGNVIDVDVVRAHCQRIEAAREAMPHFGKHALNRKGEVQGGHTFGVEPATVHFRAFPRKR
jgi:hypothetical protein